MAEIRVVVCLKVGDIGSSQGGHRSVRDDGTVGSDEEDIAFAIYARLGVVIRNNAAERR